MSVSSSHVAVGVAATRYHGRRRSALRSNETTRPCVGPERVCRPPRDHFGRSSSPPCSGKKASQESIRTFDNFASTCEGSEWTPRWSRPFPGLGALAMPVFGLRRLVERGNRAAGVVWYRHWHEVFLSHALRRRLAGIGDCVVYAQDPPAARAALRARQGPHQRVVLAVHFRISQSDEWADKEQITRGGTRVPPDTEDGTAGNSPGRRHRLCLHAGRARRSSAGSRTQRRFPPL